MNISPELSAAFLVFAEKLHDFALQLEAEVNKPREPTMEEWVNSGIMSREEYLRFKVG